MKSRKSLKELIKKTSKKEQIEIDALVLAARFLSVIQKEMDEKGWRQKDLAKSIKVSPSFVTQVFQGDKMPSFKFMAKAQRALDIKFDVSAVGEATEAFDFPSPVQFGYDLEAGGITGSSIAMSYLIKDFMDNLLNISAEPGAEAICVPMYRKTEGKDDRTWGDFNESILQVS